jgi:hypothetical protein
MVWHGTIVSLNFKKCLFIGKLSGSIRLRAHSFAKAVIVEILSDHQGVDNTFVG